jgi:hypothetical protein
MDGHWLHIYKKFPINWINWDPISSWLNCLIDSKLIFVVLYIMLLAIEHEHTMG